MVTKQLQKRKTKENNKTLQEVLTEEDEDGSDPIGTCHSCNTDYYDTKITICEECGDYVKKNGIPVQILYQQKEIENLKQEQEVLQKLNNTYLQTISSLEQSNEEKEELNNTYLQTIDSITQSNEELKNKISQLEELIRKKPSIIENNIEELKEIKGYEIPKSEYLALKKLTNIKYIKTDLEDITLNYRDNIFEVKNNHVHKLRIRSWPLTKLKDDISELRELEYLDLSRHHELIEVTEKLNELTKLKELYITHNGLEKFPNIKNMEDLEVLDVHISEIKDIPEEYFRVLNNLRQLTLDSNLALKYKDKLDQDKVFVFDVYNIGKPEWRCHIDEHIYTTVLLNDLAKVKEISEEFKPGAFYAAPTYTYYAKNNRIKGITIYQNDNPRIFEIIKDLPELENIIIPVSGIEKIPEEIYSMKQIKKLNFSGNNIKEINDINKIENLTILNLLNNPIQELPESILELENLKLLYINSKMDNKSKGIKKELRKKGVIVEKDFNWKTKTEEKKHEKN